MADTSFEEVVLDRPLHEIISDGRPADSLVVLNGLVVVSLESGQIRNFQVVLVREPVRMLVSTTNLLHPYDREEDAYASALSPSNHSAAFS